MYNDYQTREGRIGSFDPYGVKARLKDIRKKQLRKTLLRYTIALVGGLAVGAFYLHWLNSGCDLSGAMTWYGKICI